VVNLDDLELDKRQDPSTPEQPRQSKPIAALIVALVLVAGAAVLWYFALKKTPPSGVRVESESVVPSKKTERPQRVEGEHLPLPPLDETDALVRLLVGRLSSHPKVAAWLTTDQLIRNFTVAVINIADGQTPSRHLRALRLNGKFSVDDTGTSPVIDPRSYRRYDDYADAVAALDAEGAARLYATLKPRIQDASSQLGHSEHFDSVLERAIVELLKTPVVEERLGLTSKSVAYEFADPRLQSLSSAQRQLLRMGPRNVRIIQAKLREIAPHLGIALRGAE
jgi:hypothetical protein